MDENKALVVFHDKKIRRVWHNDEWFFSVVDVVEALTESKDPGNYWKVLKHRLVKEGNQMVAKCNQLKLPASDGKDYETDCAITETLFRLIQTIPSQKAEPFKLWLSRVGYDRVREIENPELAQNRMKEGREYSILTAESSKAAFGLTPSEYAKHNGLQLIFTMLGEASTTTIARSRDARGFGKNKAAANENPNHRRRWGISYECWDQRNQWFLVLRICGILTCQKQVFEHTELSGVLLFQSYDTHPSTKNPIAASRGCHNK